MSHITHPAQHSAFNPRQEGIIWEKDENWVCRQSLLSPGISSWLLPFSRSDFQVEAQTQMTMLTVTDGSILQKFCT